MQGILRSHFIQISLPHKGTERIQRVGILRGIEEDPVIGIPLIQFRIAGIQQQSIDGCNASRTVIRLCRIFRLRSLEKQFCPEAIEGQQDHCFSDDLIRLPVPADDGLQALPIRERFAHKGDGSWRLLSAAAVRCGRRLWGTAFRRWIHQNPAVQKSAGKCPMPTGFSRRKSLLDSGASIPEQPVHFRGNSSPKFTDILLRCCVVIAKLAAVRR